MHQEAARVVLVTGATSGLGRRVAGELARDGWVVLVHGRDPARCEAAAREIGERTGNRQVLPYVADLASLAEVRTLAERVRADHDRLDGLVNNAGVGGGPRGPARRELSRDGYELRFAVNYLAHYLLTQLLLTLLESAAPARVVNVTSVGQAPIDFDDVMLERGYEPFRAYAQSKLAQIMFTFDLAEQLTAGGVTGVTVNCLHPATLMDTKMVAEWFGRTASTVEEGASATMRLVTDPALEGVTGRYFDGVREAGAHDQAYDRAARARLGRLSDDLVTRAGR
ncbi:MAG: SDR family NAD(P)-dependent oxidoreductase [Carbonactinosporaceae bacterium]